MICCRLYNDPLNFYNLYNMSPKILQYLKNMTLWLYFLLFFVFWGVISLFVLMGQIPVCSVAELCLALCNPWTAAHQVSLSFTISQSLLKLTSIEPVMPSNHHILCRLLLLPSIFPGIRVFFSESALCIRRPKHSDSALVLPVSIRGWYPLGLTSLISGLL